MNEIQDVLLSLLPHKRKITPSGWTSFNAVCCAHRGESPDTRYRGGLMMSNDGSWNYHCFNCNFKAGWGPGKLLSANTKQLFKWLGLSDTDIGKLNLVALKLKDNNPISDKALNFGLSEKPLPTGSMLLTDAISSGTTEYEQYVFPIVEYLVSRGVDLDWYPWMWSPESGYRDRVIIPFFYNGKIVGWTGRKINGGKPKYLTESQAGYVFNLDNQLQDRAYVIVVEGQFDAIAIDGVAIMHNCPNDVQCARINMLGKEVIVVPDKDKPGATMLKAALEHNWSVSLPPWDDDIKDVADAVNRYGRLYTLSTILHYRTHNNIKIQLLKKQLEGLE